MLDGHKKFIGNAPIAELCVVFATVEPGSRAKGITAFVVERGDPGFVRGARLPKMGSRCFPAGELRFEECFVPDDRRLGDEGQGFSGLMEVFDVARVQLAASSLGLGRAALEHAVAYAREREAFGGRSTSSRRSRSGSPTRRSSSTRRACDAARGRARRPRRAVLDRGGDGEARGVGGVVFATWAAVQTLGGAGYIRDSPVQKWFRDAKLDEIWDGTSDIMRLIVARSLFR